MNTPRLAGAATASVLLGSVLLAGGPPAAAAGAASPITVNVLSDVQGDLADFDTVLGAYAGFPAADHMVVNGDLVASGAPAEYRDFFDVLERNPHPPASYTIGNHEFGTGATGAEHVARFQEHTGMPDMPFTREVGGVPLVHIGSLENPGKWAEGNQATLGAEQLARLDAELDRYAADEPVLVFGHHPLPDSVSGTTGAGRQDYYDLDYAESGELLDILGAHPNVVFFSGHTHYDLARDDWMNRVAVDGGDPAGFLAVNTGGVQTEWGPNPGGPNKGEWAGATDHKQALRVRVDGSEVIVTSLDFKSREVIRQVSVDMAGDYRPVERTAPSWPGGAPEGVPGAEGTLEVRRPQVRQGTAVQFSYTTDHGDTANRIEVYRAGDLPGHSSPVAAERAPKSSGRSVATTRKLAPGEYTAYLLYRGEPRTLAEPAEFTVVDKR